MAISILADIIQDFRKVDAASREENTAQNKMEKENDVLAEEYYINPVCNVPVSKKNPKHILEHEGEKVYFCCDGCKTSFEAAPEKYMNKAE